MSNTRLSGFPLVLWNDSAVASDMESAVKSGCHGGTTNPPLVLKAARADAQWAAEAARLGKAHGKRDGARRLADEIRRAAAANLLPVYTATEGKEGFLSVQVDPRNVSRVDLMVSEGEELSRLARNVHVKVPLTKTGLEAMRILLERGVSITATVSFTVSQVVEASRLYADVISRRKLHSMPVVNLVLMVGRVDDFLRALAQQRGLDVPESVITQAGVAVAKRAYSELRNQRLPGRLLLAAPRGLYHVTEFLDMDAVMTAGAAIRSLAYESDHSLTPGTAPSNEALDVLTRTFPEFVQAYEPQALPVDDFESYGASQRTLGEFVAAQEGLEEFVEECARLDRTRRPTFA